MRHYCRLFTFILLVLAGVGKLLDPYPAARSWGQWLHVDPKIMVPFFYILSVVEVATALGLFLRKTKLAGYLALGLSFVFFCLSLMRHVGLLDIPGCGCFGLLEFGPGGVAEVLRDALLVATALYFALGSRGGARVVDWRS